MDVEMDWRCIMDRWIPPESGLGSEGPPAGGYPPDNKGDKELTSAVETALFLEPNIDESRFVIRTENGVVSVVGTAKSDDERQRVLDLALGIDGVREVIDQVRVVKE
jgi:osmotically-inducible protein OsmY